MYFHLMQTAVNLKWSILSDLRILPSTENCIGIQIPITLLTDRIVRLNVYVPAGLTDRFEIIESPGLFTGWTIISRANIR